MQNQHFSTASGAVVCRPHTLGTTYGNPPQIARRSGRKPALSMLVCLLLALPAQSLAQQNDDLLPTTEEQILNEILEEQLEFDPESAARGKHFCQIVLVNDGVLHEIPGAFRLSSKGAGGRPGVAQVTATRSSYRISVDAPLGFTNAPAGGNSGLTMQASYSANGATGFTETPGNIQQKLKRGVTTIEAHLDVNRNGTPFPAGNYSAELTLRCE